MKINLTRIAKTIATKARENPELALVLLGLVAPKVAAKATPIIVAATRKP
ncbi:hypothetical protein [Sphingomonas sp. CCH5-D11]|nr:hypothetical protein [Sphingomonas sp. CCH5-D11]